MHRQGENRAQACDSTAPAELLAITSFRLMSENPLSCRSSESVSANKMTVNENIKSSSSVLVEGGSGPSGQSPRPGGAGSDRTWAARPAASELKIILLEGFQLSS